MSGGTINPVVVDRLTVRYGQTRAVDAVSLAVAPGAVYALLGRNGAGKSSLVRCLLGQRKANDGSVSLFGRDAWRERTALMARVGVVPEEPDAPPEMNASQLVAFCARLYPRWDGAAVAERLERFDVPQRVPFGRLSKGQKAQLALALALGPRPELLVLDDPTLGLDVVARRELYEELIGELADRGTTVFLTTHDLAGVEGIADRVGILKAGRLVLDGEMETLKARFRRVRFGTRAVAAAGGADGLVEFETVSVRRRGWGVEAVVDRFGDDAFSRLRSREEVVDAEAEAMSLEEIFVAVVGEEKGGAS